MTMGKPQNGKKNGTQGMSPAKAIQQGQVKKNKQEKFKKTPGGKVQVINGKSNGNAVNKKPFNQSPGKKPQNTPSPKNNNNNNKKNNNKNQKKSPAKKEIKNNVVVKKEEKDDDDSEISDLDEGIPAIPEDVSMDGEHDSDDSDDDAEETPDIFGQSLAEDTDDEDFTDDEEEASKNGNKMGIKPFKGVKSVKKEDSELDTTGASSVNSSMVTEDDDTDDSDDDEDSKSGLKALIGDSILDSENDEDFEEDEEDDDDDDDISDDDEELELNQSATSIDKVENGKPVILSEEEKAELDSRTVFVGNVPMAVDEKKIKSIFKSYGTIDTIRIRGIIPESPQISKKVASITKKFHPKVTAKCAFVRFDNVESAGKALAVNGTQLDGNYLRVDKASADRQVDPKKAVFVGNLKFDIEDNDLWEMFKKCGKIEWVRTIRDRLTGCCRGLAYINFAKEDSTALALNLNGQLLKGREMRVSPYKVLEKKPKHAGGKRSRSADSTSSSPAKKSKREIAIAIATHNSKNAEQRKNGNKRSQGEQKRANNAQGKTQASPKGKGTFQGQKADNKKPFKKGANKFEKQKKNMAAKLTAKPKKPVKN